MQMGDNRNPTSVQPDADKATNAGGMPQQGVPNEARPKPAIPGFGAINPRFLGGHSGADDHDFKPHKGNDEGMIELT